MGRGKIEIKKIESVSGRQVTFSKRRSGLLKKAHELSVLCDAQVAVVIFSNTGKLFEFASSSMNQILSRYNKCLETSIVDPEAENNFDEVAVLKEEFAQLKQKQMQLLGNDLNGMGLNELEQLEQLLNNGLSSVKDRKEQMLMHQLEQSRMKEKNIMADNTNLQKQIAELQMYLPINAQPLSSFPVHSRERELLPETHAASSSLTECKGGAENVDTILQLGTPSHCQRKRKEPEQETAEKESGSGTSESQIDI